MKVLSIDIETFSSADIRKSGVYKYIESSDFEILLFAYTFDEEPIKIIDRQNLESIPLDVIFALTDPQVLKTSHNANFEISCIRKFYDIKLDASQWECTMSKAAMLGLPLSLDAVAKVLKLSAQKSASGKALIKYFSMPCKPTKANGGRTRNLPEHAPEKWQEFKDYCVQDVEVERQIRNKISWFKQPEFEKQLWNLDQKINDTGIEVDTKFVENVIKIDTQTREKLMNEAVELTGLQNPNSTAQLRDWLTGEGLETENLQKQNLPDLIESTGNDKVRKILVIRQQLSKSSIKKYQAMLHGVCTDGRIRGLLQYYGANRTGRWAGRLVQIQNMPRISIEDIDCARECVKTKDIESLEMCYGNIPLTLSELIRTAFVAAPGHRFIVSDFSAIEARVIAWLAGEKWRLEVFKTHGKIYEASASAMFRIPMEEITKLHPARQKGKIAELALGYQGGPGALERMDKGEAFKDNWKMWHQSLHGFKSSRLDPDELQDLVYRWRDANQKIVEYWYRIQDAAIRAVEGTPQKGPHRIKMFVEKNVFFIQLPSGRKLSYLRPSLRDGNVRYEGMNQTTKQWGLQESYGGKFVENIVQAIARDCLAEKMMQIDQAGYKIAFHVHDEIVCEMKDGKGSIEEVNRIMSEPISWAEGLPLAAETFETTFYKKD